jgi:hypothetical protein
MAQQERASLRKPAAVRRPAIASRIQPVAATARATPVARTLQQRLGNQGTQALAAHVVARAGASGSGAARSVGAARTLSISRPGDAHEREAESVADAVMGMHSSKPASGSCVAGVSRTAVQRKEGSATATEIAPSVSVGIDALKGGGSPLPATTRSFFEPRFGADFGNVRVHTGSRAASAASSINARAFTVGRDIAFNAGQYAPHSRDGQRLLAHELTHVVQQSGAQSDASGGTIMRAPFPPFMRGSPPPGPPPPKKPDPSPAALTAGANEVVELKGHTTFDPSPALAELIDWLSPKISLAVRVRFGPLAYGMVDIKKRDTGYVSVEDPAMIDLHHPGFPGGGYYSPPRMQLSIINSVVTGRVEFFPWDRLKARAIPMWTSANPLERLLGWKGIDKIRTSGFVNEVKGGVLRYALDKFDYRLDKEWEGVGSFSVTDEQVVFSAQTDIKVPGVADAKMPLEWAGGKVFGAAKLSLTLAPRDILGGTFSGSIEGSFAGGVTNITGEASYRSKKLNGTVTIRVAPIEEALAQLSNHVLAGLGTYTFAAGPSTKHAVFGWGVLDFHYNEWLSGRASVVVDPFGYITSFGVIRPTKEFMFLTADKYGARTSLGKGSASAFYPVWLTTGITGTITGELFAAGRLGPVTIHDLELSGVFSTNPAVPLQVQLSGIIDVSAIGRMELSLTGSLSYTLVGKHVETVTITVNVLGTGTIKAYALLKPTFALEKAKGADPQFRMKATFKVAAGLYLGLQGSIKASLFGVGPRFKSNKYQWQVGGVGLKSEFDYLIGDPAGPALGFDSYKFDPTEFHNKAEDLLDDAAEKYDKKKQETEARQDQAKRALPGPKPAPKIAYFKMNNVRHELWIEPDPLPTLYMASRGKPFKKNLRAEAAQLKKAEDAAAGGQKALIKAEETAVAALMKQAVDVESSAESLEERQADVAGLQELARQIEIYATQYSKADIGDRTADMDSDEAELLDQEGLVGSYSALRAAGTRADDITPHHMPQDKYMEYKLKGSPGGETWSRNEGVCINMYHPIKTPKKGRHFFTRSYGSFGDPPRYKETPMEALQKDIANVRAVYEKDKLLNARIKDGLALVHALNVKNYPKLFRGGP